jgi:hypothetical protein
MRVALLLFLLHTWCSSSFYRMHVVLLLLLPDARGVAPLPPPPGVRQTSRENEDDAPNRMLRLHFWITGRPQSKMRKTFGAAFGDIF